jgi:hypothetical protein
MNSHWLGEVFRGNFHCLQYLPLAYLKLKNN